MIFDKMKRNYFRQLCSIVLIMHTIQPGLIVSAASASHEARPKIDLSDPFYNGQIHYDDTLEETETPIGTIVYAIDDESVEVDPFDRTKTFQLQDVVTHGNPNDKSFINHNLFTIGDGNDAIIDSDSDEDDDIDDVIDIDGVVDKQATAIGAATPAEHSKFANFAFTNEKPIPKHKAAANKNADKNQAHNRMQQKHQPINATNQNTERDQHQGQQQQQQQQQTINNVIAAAHLPNRQMTYKHSNKTSTARMKSHRHHNRKTTHHNGKWYRRHQKWLKQHKTKVHRNRHSSASSRSGLKPQRINSSIKSNARAPPSYVQAHVSFYDSSFDDTLTSNRFNSNNNHRSTEKWPHLKRLQSQLHQDIMSDSLPPYIKKYSRRNKQLIGLLEGEGMPNVDNNAETTAKQQFHSRRRQKQNSKWIEKNLFEEQLDNKKNDSIKPTAAYSSDAKSILPIILNSKQRYLTEKNVQSEPNALPGEHLSLSSEDYNDCVDDDDGSDCVPSTLQHSKAGRIKKKQNISPKADSFLFHRVATPKLVGTAAIAGGLIRQKLPFVALTDKRIEDGSRQRRINTVQNTFPLP